MRSDPENELADAIREAFKATGWSIKRLADESGCAYAAVYGMVHETRDVSTGTASKLCATLGLKLIPAKRIRKYR